MKHFFLLYAWWTFSWNDPVADYFINRHDLVSTYLTRLHDKTLNKMCELIKFK